MQQGDKDADDGSQVGALLDRIDDPIASFTADGAFDRDDVYAAVAARHPEADVVVPPRSGAVPSGTAETAPTRRDAHLRCIAERGRMGWQRASGYKLASLGRGRYRALETGGRRRAPLVYGRAPGDRGGDRRRRAEPHARPRTPGVRPHRMTRNTGGAQCVHTADPCNKVLDASARTGRRPTLVSVAPPAPAARASRPLAPTDAPIGALT
jgi:hypothetical protein